MTRRQLLRAGLTVAQVNRRLRSGDLIAEYPGVYRVGHQAPNILATYMAAVLACGDGAALAGRAAAHLLGLIRRAPPAPEVLSETRRSIPGLVARRTRRLERADRTVWRGIPVTTPARTIVDLAAVLTEEDLAEAFHEAGIKHHTRPEQVEAVLQRRPNSPAAATVRRVIWGDSAILLSALERRFRELLDQASLPLPITNRPAGSKYVDCRWPEHALTVELDSYRFHRSRHAWEQDHRRAREARDRGDEFRRYAYFDVFEEPEPMIAEVAGLLRTRSSGTPPAPA